MKSNYQFLSVALLLCLTAALTSCGSYEEPIQVREAYVIDRTVEINPNVVQHAIDQGAASSVGIHGDSLTGYDVTAISMGGKRYPEGCPESIALQEPGMGHVPAARKQEVRQGLGRIATLTDCVFADSISTQNTYFYQPIVDVLTEMADDEASIKRVVIFSDAMQHSEELSLYRYLRDPKGMDADREELLDEIDRIHGPIPSMEGVVVEFYPMPSENEQTACQAAQRLLKAWVERHGGTFSRRILNPNLAAS